MMLYEFSLAPSPRRVRMFIAEKGIEIASTSRSTPASASSSQTPTAP